VQERESLAIPLARDNRTENRTFKKSGALVCRGFRGPKCGSPIQRKGVPHMFAAARATLNPDSKKGCVPAGRNPSNFRGREPRIDSLSGALT
jgi:hypothetical protein